MTSALSLQSSTTTIDRQQQSGLSQLPPETIIHVLVYSKIKDIAAFGSTCKYFREISQDNHLWSILFERDFHLLNVSNWATSILSMPGHNVEAYKVELFSRTVLTIAPKNTDVTDYLKEILGYQVIRK